LKSTQIAGQSPLFAYIDKLIGDLLGLNDQSVARCDITAVGVDTLGS